MLYKFTWLSLHATGPDIPHYLPYRIKSEYVSPILISLDPFWLHSFFSPQRNCANNLQIIYIWQKYGKTLSLWEFWNSWMLAAVLGSYW
jgi:hypothetical protein